MVIRVSPSDGVVPLAPAVRRYAWGSVDALPALLGEDPDGEPVAELWFGTHPAGSATVVIDGRTAALDELADLPFMVKLIAAAQPLSIQVHPSAEQAARRFAEEAASAVPDAERRYQDPHAKPEIVVALDDFDALIDFRPSEDIATELEHAGLRTLADTAQRDGLHALVRAVLSADRADPERTSAALVDRGDELAARLARSYPRDPGVVIATFLTRIRLQHGEAAFLGPGTVHAYLGGTAVEIMSTSDNVLRAGLTSKLVDVDEFLSVARCEPGDPDVLRADAGGAYPDRAPEFSVRRYAGAPFELEGPAIVVATSGTVTVGERCTLGRGRAAFVPDSPDRPTVAGAGEAYIAERTRG
jgi:mannose-6-phosphate isomerase